MTRNNDKKKKKKKELALEKINMMLLITADIGDVHNDFRLLYRPNKLLKTRAISYGNISNLGRDDFITG